MGNHTIFTILYSVICLNISLQTKPAAKIWYNIYPEKCICGEYRSSKHGKRNSKYQIHLHRQKHSIVLPTYTEFVIFSFVLIISGMVNDYQFLNWTCNKKNKNKMYKK